MSLVITLTEMAESPTATWITGGQHEYIRRVQCALSDDGTPTVVDPTKIGPNTLLTSLAFELFSLSLGSPYQLIIDGTVEDDDPLATCRTITPERDPARRDRWIITASYNTLTESDNTYDAIGNEDVGDWLTQRPVVRWQNIMFTEHAREAYQYSKGPVDSFGHYQCPPNRDTPADWTEMNNGAKGGIANSGGGWLGDPPPERDMQRTGWVIERNMNMIDQNQIDALTNSVNTFGDFTFDWQGITYTIPRYFGKIKEILPREHFRGGSWVWRVRYEIDINPRSWIEDYLDEGFQTINLADVPAYVFGQTQASNVKDATSLLTSIPALLNGKGDAWPIEQQSGFENVDLSKVCYNSFLLYEKQNWSDSANWMFADFPNNHNRIT
jgi:hypothetical protein